MRGSLNNSTRVKSSQGNLTNIRASNSSKFAGIKFLIVTATTKSKAQTGFSNKEEEYISNLQKQVYYLELEMKLMKDREMETKNKVGGYGIILK